MTKQEFLKKLRKGLSGLPQDDIEERLTFYNEMIEDRMEEGLPEEEAVAEAGDIDTIISQTISDIPLAKLAKERVKPKRRLNRLEIVLLILSSVIWLPLGIAIIAVFISLYAAFWSVIISLWSVFVALAASSFGSIIAGIGLMCNGSLLPGMAMISAGLVCVGFSIFTFYGCKVVTKGILVFTKKLVLVIKNCFVKKEEA
ncbi:MAG: DUF1700 domain-containing protein [Lachnospiraceae bacterium]|nr:DUF1700 domain-containing protein [Lachnospiraceae bacterium]